ncbi:DUF6779 domain-containing protein [Mycolicibacterium sp. 050158]|uniref:DUF6779 domain-containing protein n=1 Tax=Mycolicibacterium sp. 050158 TaxID=3090602 RepID=UPI00299DFA98|nr:DUF6779 domain-containing protein [Mycolicibacterium sp. 050158]MDX1889859.1 DUF6779 domain-containing protein [Mycolicibacterium sp. 050158]
MTDPTRGTRARRGNRRPGSLLLTALLVLAIVASSALVFTNKVELLKLAVIVSLWAAVAAAFVSFIYRRQSDIDQAKSRDLKLVYDLQLDREIAARREYELSVEAQLRRELASELRAQASDEVANLRAELAALRTNLEIIFDTDLQSRPALETERTTVHHFGDWDAFAAGTSAKGGGPGEERDRSFGPGRVISSRIDTEAREDSDPNTEESPIIDVPVEPQPPEDPWAPQVPGGAHRRASEGQPVDAGWRQPGQPPAPPQREPTTQSGPRRPWAPVEGSPPPAPPPQPPPSQPEEPGRHVPAGNGWRPAPAEGQFIPAGAPGSNWASPVVERGEPNPAGSAGPEPAMAEPAAPEPAMAGPAAQPAPAPPAEPTPPPPAMTPPSAPESPRPGRHYSVETAETAAAAAAESARRARHSAPSEADPGRRTAPTLASPAPAPSEAQERQAARHRGAEDSEESAGQHIGGQPVSELMARLQASSTGGGRRRRREE